MSMYQGSAVAVFAVIVSTVNELAEECMLSEMPMI